MSLQDEDSIGLMGVGSKQSEPALTVCIVTYNRRDDLEHALQSVYDNTPSPSEEVIVVDNHSTDGTVELIQEKYPQVQIIHNLVNQGYSPAMNLALAKARGQFVLTLSHDAELKTGSVEAFVRFMGTHPAAGLAGPRTVDTLGKIVTTLHHPSLLLSIWTEIIPVKTWLRRAHLIRLVLTKLFPNSSGLTSNYTVTHQVPVLDGGCLFIRREVLNSVGLLDPRIPQGPDDYDWCYRIRQKGFEVWFVAESEVIHRKGPKEDLGNVDPLYSLFKMPQLCYLFGKYHHGLLIKLFNWSAWLLTWKWRIEARRRYGTITEYEVALKKAAFLCLHPEQYIRNYQTIWSAYFYNANPDICTEMDQLDRAIGR